MREKVLITGAAGFVGRHLVRKLTDRGCKVIALDKDPTVLELGVEAHQLDIRYDQDKIADLAARTKKTYHLANVARVEPSWANYREYYETNVIATVELFEICQKANHKTFLYVSSSSVYGDNDVKRQTEKSQCHPTNPYAASKLAAEHALRVQGTMGRTRLTIARPFCMYGDGMAEGPYAMALNKFLAARAAGKALEIHSDGEQRRDMISVEEAVDAFIILMMKGFNNGIYNVGSGNNISIKELADLISPKQKFTKGRPGREYNTLADMHEMQVMGFKPKADVRDWIRNHLTSLPNDSKL